MEDYQRCPRYWHYRRRYEPIGLPAPWTTIGSAVHAGLARFYAGQIPSADVVGAPKVTAVQEGLTYLREHWRECAELDLIAAEKIVEQGITVGMATPIVGVPLAVEETFTDCTVDLLVGVPEGVEIWDFKWRYRLEDQWVSKTMSKTRHMNQLYHNAWRVGEVMGGTPVRAVGQAMICFSPKTRVRYYRHEMTPKRLANWLVSHQTWRERAIQDEQRFREYGLLPPMNFHACDDYGGCPFTGICLDRDGDERNLDMVYRVLPGA